jgi:hypothetical protein
MVSAEGWRAIHSSKEYLSASAFAFAREAGFLIDRYTGLTLPPLPANRSAIQVSAEKLNPFPLASGSYGLILLTSKASKSLPLPWYTTSGLPLVSTTFDSPNHFLNALWSDCPNTAPPGATCPRDARNALIDPYTDFNQVLNRRISGCNSTLGALPSITYCSMLSAQRSWYWRFWSRVIAFHVSSAARLPSRSGAFQVARSSMPAHFRNVAMSSTIWAGAFGWLAMSAITSRKKWPVSWKNVLRFALGLRTNSSVLGLNVPRGVVASRWLRMLGSFTSALLRTFNASSAQCAPALKPSDSVYWSDASSTSLSERFAHAEPAVFRSRSRSSAQKAPCSKPANSVYPPEAFSTSRSVRPTQARSGLFTASPARPSVQVHSGISPVFWSANTVSSTLALRLASPLGP